MRNAFALAAISLLAIGCSGNGGNIVGSWSDDTTGVTVRFASDGTYHQVNAKGPSRIHIEGTYTLSRNHLVMQKKDATYEHVSQANQDSYNHQLKTEGPDESEVEFVNPNQINIFHRGLTEEFNRG